MVALLFLLFSSILTDIYFVDVVKYLENCYYLIKLPYKQYNEMLKIKDYIRSKTFHLTGLVIG